MIRTVLITVSTSRAGAGNRISAPDLSGERLLVLAESVGSEVIGRELIPDGRQMVRERLIHWADERSADLILTSGGTGFSPSDQTPEATAEIIERPAPGIAEALRAAAAGHTTQWPLSRGTAGIRGTCLIINLPGSPKSIDQSVPVLKPILGHAIDLIRERPAKH